MPTLALRSAARDAALTIAAVPRKGVGPALTNALLTLVGLVVLVALVIVVRVGLYALGHADQPMFRELIRLVSS